VGGRHTFPSGRVARVSGGEPRDWAWVHLDSLSQSPSSALRWDMGTIVVSTQYIETNTTKTLLESLSCSYPCSEPLLGFRIVSFIQHHLDIVIISCIPICICTLAACILSGYSIFYSPPPGNPFAKTGRLRQEKVTILRTATYNMTLQYPRLILTLLPKHWQVTALPS
jgi:hypothetical protein